MPLHEAWRVLGVPPGATRGDLKKAFRERVKRVHPDVVGDDGTQLRRVQEAFEAVQHISDPTQWDFQGSAEAGLPAWAAGLLNGIQWSEDCPGYAAFLDKADQKSLAVGEYDEREGLRPWGAAWGKYSQEDANAEALRLCRQYGGRCRLIYVGSGSARVKRTPSLTPSDTVDDWWQDHFAGGGKLPGFGWMPMIDQEREKLVGHKNVKCGEEQGEPMRLRVPVFQRRTAKGGVTGLPYYYTPLRPKTRVFMKKQNFRHLEKESDLLNMKKHPRWQHVRLMQDEHTSMSWDAKEATQGMAM